MAMPKRKNHNWCGIALVALYGLFSIYASFFLSYLNKDKTIGKLSNGAIAGIRESFIVWGVIFVIGAIILAINEYIIKPGRKEARDTEEGVSPHY